MDNKKLIALLSISIFIVIMATAGVTYAYLSLGAEQTTPNVISTACFNVGFNETQTFNIVSYPMTDASAFKNIKPYNFTISKENSCATNIKYEVYLNVMNTSTLDTSLIKYSLDGKTALTLTEEKDLPVGADRTGVKESYLIDSGLLTDSSAAKNLYMWIMDTAGNEIMGQKFETQILVYSVPVSN